MDLNVPELLLNSIKWLIQNSNDAPTGSVMEPFFYSPFKELPKKNVNIGIRNLGEELKSLGSGGNNIEIEWIETIKNAIIEKTKLVSFSSA